jgi:hypothetical protein
MRKANSWIVFSVVILGGVVLVSTYFVLARGGWLAWCGAIFGCLGFAVISRLPDRLKLWCSIAILLSLGFSWLVTTYYVYSTWESGEVIEIEIAAEDYRKTVRTWVVDHDGTPFVAYDADPTAARVLKSVQVLNVTRSGKSYVSSPEVFLTDEAEADVIAVFGQFSEKYGELTEATAIYYSLLGRNRDQVSLIIKLNEMRQVPQDKD